MPVLSVPHIIAHRRRRSTRRRRESRIPWLTILTAVSFVAGITITANAGPDVQAVLGIIAAGYLVALAVHVIAGIYTGEADA